MIKKDSSKVTGIVNVVVRDDAGKIKQEFTVPNLVVDTGLDFIASRMKDTSATAMSHMGVGTGSTAASSADTALGTQLARVALASAPADDNAADEEAAAELAEVAISSAATDEAAVVDAPEALAVLAMASASANGAADVEAATALSLAGIASAAAAVVALGPGVFDRFINGAVFLLLIKT